MGDACLPKGTEEAISHPVRENLSGPITEAQDFFPVPFLLLVQAAKATGEWRQMDGEKNGSV
ncbi:MAG: hypothetical protein GXY32_00805 [Ruminococcaceae bacterium]|nr:hypothetical protein [Oscillospiraceae bacterium]